MMNVLTWIQNHQKTFYTIVIGIICLIVGPPLLFRMLDNREKYDWSVDLLGEQDSKEPFGAYYFDRYLESKWKKVERCDSSLYDCLKANKSRLCNYLVMKPSASFTPDSLKDRAVLEAIGKGNNILFCRSDSYFTSRLGIRCYNVNYFSIWSIKHNKEDLKYSGLYYAADGEFFRGETPDCQILNDMINERFEYEPELFDIDEFGSDLAKRFPADEMTKVVRGDMYSCVVAMEHIGKGRFITNGVPVLFSNFAVSDSAMCKLTEKVMQTAFDSSKPLVIVYGKKISQQQKRNVKVGKSTFYVLLEKKQTALALYILFIVFMLCLVMNVRRKRSAEQSLPLERNASISYIRHLATLYTGDSDYKELLQIEQRNLLYRLRKEYRFDLRTKDFALPSEYAGFIARSKKLDENAVRDVLQRMEMLTSSFGTITRESYVDCLKQLHSVIETS